MDKCISCTKPIVQCKCSRLQIDLATIESLNSEAVREFAGRQAGLVDELRHDVHRYILLTSKLDKKVRDMRNKQDYI